MQILIEMEADMGNGVRESEGEQSWRRGSTALKYSDRGLNRIVSHPGTKGSQ